MLVDQATREVFWNIPAQMQVFFYLAAGLTVLVFIAGFLGRISIWTKGKEDEFGRFGRLDFIRLAVTSFFSPDCILARRSFSIAAYRGVMLLFIIWGFTTLFAGTALLTIDHYAIKFLQGSVYFVYSLALDAAGALLLTGVLVALLRRYLVRSVSMVTSYEDSLFLFLLLAILLLGFSIEGIRISALKPEDFDYSPVGFLFSKIFGFEGDSLLALYRLLWTAHFALAFVFIAYLPFSKMFHLFAAQITVSAASRRYGGLQGGR